MRVHEIHTASDLVRFVETDARPGSVGLVTGPIEDLPRLPPFRESGDEKDGPITIRGIRRPLLACKHQSWPIFQFPNGAGYYHFQNLRGRGGYAFAMIHPNIGKRPGDNRIHHITMAGLDLQGYEKGAIYIRNAGVDGLRAYDCRFTKNWGEGNVDIGEYKPVEHEPDPDKPGKTKPVENPWNKIPRTGSRNLSFIGCTFAESMHNQGCGIVSQPTSSDILLYGCRVYNNRDYGIGLKCTSSPAEPTRIIKTEVWGNGSSQVYLRGMDFFGHKGAFDVRDCAFVGCRGMRGGGVFNWREMCDVELEEVLILAYMEAGDKNGYGLLANSTNETLCTLGMRRTRILGYGIAPCIRAVPKEPTENAVIVDRGENVLWSQGTPVQKKGKAPLPIEASISYCDYDQLFSFNDDTPQALEWSRSWRTDIEA